jgi:hypothetical protein
MTALSLLEDLRPGRPLALLLPLDFTQDSIARRTCVKLPSTRQHLTAFQIDLLPFETLSARPSKAERCICRLPSRALTI